MGEPNKKLWIGNLSYKVQKEDLDALFRQYGTIADIKLLDKGPHVYAFVEYEKQDAATEAYEKLQSRELKGNDMKIEYANGRKRNNNKDREGRDRDQYKRRDNYRRRSRSRSYDRHRQKSKSHRRRSSSSESSRHHKSSKQKANRPKSPDNSGLSNS